MAPKIETVPEYASCVKDIRNEKDYYACYNKIGGEEKKIRMEHNKQSELTWNALMKAKTQLCLADKMVPYPEFNESDPLPFFNAAYQNVRIVNECRLSDAIIQDSLSEITALMEISRAKSLLKSSSAFGPIEGNLTEEQGELLRYLDRLNPYYLDAVPDGDVFLPTYSAGAIAGAALGAWINPLGGLLGGFLCALLGTFPGLVAVTPVEMLARKIYNGQYAPIANEEELAEMISR